MKTNVKWNLQTNRDTPRCYSDWVEPILTPAHRVNTPCSADTSFLTSAIVQLYSKGVQISFHDWRCSLPPVVYVCIFFRLVSVADYFQIFNKHVPTTQCMTCSWVHLCTADFASLYPCPFVMRYVETWQLDHEVSYNNVIDHRIWQPVQLGKQLSCLVMLHIEMQAMGERHQHAQANLDGFWYCATYVGCQFSA